MTWTKKPIPAPLIDGVEELATNISSITQPVVTLLDLASSALEVAKIFFATQASPTTALANALIDEVQNLNNDIFGSGVFQLVVQPFEINKKFGVPLIGQAGPIDTETKLFGLQQTGTILPSNDFGIPSLTPSRVIDKIVQSFDDQGDLERPQFSNNASVAAFGFMVSAPDVNGFVSLLEGLQAVWDFGAFSRLLNQMKQKANFPSGFPTPVSRPPDWDSVRFNSIDFMKKTQDQLNNQLNFLRGLLGSTDNLLNDFLTLIERKINNLQATVSEFNELINTIKNATAASGVYVLDVPAGVGGNERLKQEIRDDQFSDSRDNLAAAVIYVGGGPSVAAVEAIRQIVAA